MIYRVGGPTTRGSYGYLRVQDVFATDLVRRSTMTRYESRTDHMMGALILRGLDSPSRIVSVIGSICAQRVERIIHKLTLPPGCRVGTILRFTGRGDPAFSASSITVAELKAS